MRDRFTLNLKCADHPLTSLEFLSEHSEIRLPSAESIGAEARVIPCRECSREGGKMKLVLKELASHLPKSNKA